MPAAPTSPFLGRLRKRPRWFSGDGPPTQACLVRAERAGQGSRLWFWAIYRAGEATPSRKSMAMFPTDEEAIEAGRQVVRETRRRSARPGSERPGF